MPKLTIDNQTVEVPAGTTILDAAGQLGIEIPTLCYLRGYEPSTSCQVCLVKDRRRGQLVPSCATKVVDGMEIESETDRSSHSPSHGVGIAVQRSRGRLSGPVLLRLPGSHGHPADAAADWRA